MKNTFLPVSTFGYSRMEEDPEFAPREQLRAITRGYYDIQKLRIMMGNRITMNFRHKLGLSNKNKALLTEEEKEKLEKEAEKILKQLTDAYVRITDGVVDKLKIAREKVGDEHYFGELMSKLPSVKKFEGNELISTYSELVMMDQYMTLVRNEEATKKRLVPVLEQFSIYNEFLVDVDGCGPAMSAVIISEFDPYKAQYPSSFWAYAGLDNPVYGFYVDRTGKEITVSNQEVLSYFEDNPDAFEMYVNGYLVEFRRAARNKQAWALVDREYVDKEGETKTKKSITFNPFLHTKLLGVLGPQFLKAVRVTVDGTVTKTAARIGMAEDLGFAFNPEAKTTAKQQADDFLNANGHKVVYQRSPYAEEYYDYKYRLDNHPVHHGKTKLHKHRMSNRYSIQRFVVDLHVNWRRLKGLPVSTEYAEGKLGKVHKIAGWAQHQEEA